MLQKKPRTGLRQFSLLNSIALMLIDYKAQVLADLLNDQIIVR